MSRKLYKRYDEMLNESNPIVKIGLLQYNPSHVLKQTDPIAYEVGFSDWCTEEDLNEDLELDKDGETNFKGTQILKNLGRLK